MGGGGHNVTALVSNEEYFGDIKAMVAKCRDFSKNSSDFMFIATL